MEWKPVKGLEGLYEISNTGLVKSLRRIGKIMTQYTTKCGYKRTALYDKNMKQKHYFVHRLVAKAFLENHDLKKWVNHKNGIKTDNVVGNLEWCTPSENHFHAYRTGLKSSKGEKHFHKVTESDVREIRMSDKPVKELALKFGVTKCAIWDIRARRCWTHI